MKNSKTLFLDLVNAIKLPDNRDEVQSIVYILMEHIFSLSRTDIQLEKAVNVNSEAREKMTNMIDRINTEEPVQYIVGNTEFYGRRFYVNASVLIPRPETEELIRFVSATFADKKEAPFSCLDIGTGSGCIGISLALEFSNASVYVTDVSPDALEVAKKNAAALNASITLLNHDILVEDIPMRNLDLIVSNPPYIARNEMQQMSRNVVSFEPHLALFVEDDDPLLFYKFISEKARHALRPGGLLIVEVNERYGAQVAALFERSGFKEISVIKDLFGKKRIVKGICL